MDPSQQDRLPSTPPPPPDSASPQPCPHQRSPEPLDLGFLAQQIPAATRPSNPSGPPSTAPSVRGSLHTPGPFSPGSIGSDRQLGHQSVPSDTSGDRVFPIRSVVSVNPSTRRTTGEGPFSPAVDSELHGVAASRPSATRGDTLADLRRSETSVLSPASHTSADFWSRKRSRTLSGFSAGTSGEAAQHGTVPPLQLNLLGSDKVSEESGVLGGEASHVAGDAGRRSSSASGSQSIESVPHVATRFTHVDTKDGHAIITGRDDNLQRCEDEPIHTPGAVQGYGVLVALREESDGRFVVRYVSENSAMMLGLSPRQLFKLKNFLDILTEEQQDNLLDHIDFIRDEDADPAVNGPEVFSISIRPPKKRSLKLWCALHINPAHQDLVICEFEWDDDQIYPLRPPDELTPDSPHDTLLSNPSREDLEESTEILSKPLRILRSARKRRGEQGAMQVFDIMSQVQEQLASAANLDTFLKILVGIVKELTGFHRVMIYQFDASFNGKVVTELVDAKHTIDLYKGLHFPASDIPRQARDLYKLNKVRLLYDRDLQTARIVCRTKEDLETPLDMSHANLRAMSPIHLKYLGNMAVRSSMSISINAFNELWGLIACHSYGNHGMRVSFPIRKMCRLVGDTASRNIERLSYASRLQARKLINTTPTDKNPSGYIIASSDDLLRLFDADFGVLSIKGETKIMGTMEQSQEALAMLEYLRMRKLTSVVASQDLREDFPDLQYPPGFHVIAGLLYVPLSVGGHDFIVFFRRGQIKEVKWAGNPYEKTIREGTAGYLEPRKSFRIWQEMVVGKCREWNEEQVETAAVLCLVYGKFIEVWRQKEAAMQSSNLTRLLLANSAHEVRTPLNAIINYLEIALEGSLDQETRENLARSHSASKSLIYVINDLLDLAKAEEGQNLIKDEAFDLPACIKEAMDPFNVDARRKGIDYTVTLYPGLPRFVHGDGRRVRQALSNITANAIAHTDGGGFVKVEALVSAVMDGQVNVEFVVADSGAGMSSQQLDALFRDLEQVSTEELGPRLSPQTADRPSSIRTLGLGLAVVARIVRNMDGQLRLKSEEGQGSRFVVQLPFQVPGKLPELRDSDDGDPQTQFAANLVAPAPAATRASPDGEIMLVDRPSAEEAKFSFEARSTGSLHSGGSLGSHGSHKSDADRLIDAIQTPLELQERQPDYFRLSHESKAGTSWSASRVDVDSATKSTRSIRSSSPRTNRHGLPSPGQVRDEAGTLAVRDSKTPIRPVKIPDDYADMPTRPQTGEQSRVLFEIPGDSQSMATSGSVTSGGTGEGEHLQVLIAEDDPINMKIMRKRLERAGHEVSHAVNGEDCATVYRGKSSAFDVILMDMQMPIVDGLTATKMIRGYERSPEHGRHSQLAASIGRVPIFAVSASLQEKEMPTYVDAGFDGWILKPIDFKRLHTLLRGIFDEETRRECLHVDGQWERGGWFPRSEGQGIKGEVSEEVTPKAEDDEKEMPAPAAEGESQGTDGSPTDESTVEGLQGRHEQQWA